MVTPLGRHALRRKAGKARRMGRARFVWLVGVCGWGIPVAVAWGVAFWHFTTPRPPMAAVLAVAALAFPPAGYVFGRAVWWLTEKGDRAARERDRCAEADEAW